MRGRASWWQRCEGRLTGCGRTPGPRGDAAARPWTGFLRVVALPRRLEPLRSPLKTWTRIGQVRRRVGELRRRAGGAARTRPADLEKQRRCLRQHGVAEAHTERASSSRSIAQSTPSIVEARGHTGASAVLATLNDQDQTSLLPGRGQPAGAAMAHAEHRAIAAALAAPAIRPPPRRAMPLPPSSIATRASGVLMRVIAVRWPCMV